MTPVAWVTGASRGIGLAAAERLAAEGYHLVVSDLRGAAMDEVVGLVEAKGRQALALTVDVADHLDWTAAVLRIEQVFGRLDALINNAGISGPIGRFEDCAVADFDQVHAVNTRGVFLGMKASLPLLKRRGGAIVNIASISGLSGGRNTIAYTASKHAVIGMTKQVANELAGFGVRVNAVCPAPTATLMMRALAEQHRPDDPDGFEADFASFIPMGRYGQPAEMADAIAFLVSAQASFITGVALPVDGGATAR